MAVSQIETNSRWNNEQATLHLGDALDVFRSIPDESVDCVWTDPPYNLSNDGVTCVAGKMVPVNKGEWDRSKGLEGDYEFNRAWTEQCFRVLKPTGSIWVTGTLHVHSSVGMALQHNGFRLLNDIVWQKTNPPPNLGCRTFKHSTELLFWASKSQKGDKRKYKFHYEAMKRVNGGKQMGTVWKMSSPRQKEKTFGKHPTQKPIELIMRCLRATTDNDDVVLDPFMGSGSTGVAAVGLNRQFVGIELNDEFFRIAIKRIEAALPPPSRHVGRVWIVIVKFRFCYFSSKETYQEIVTDGAGRSNPTSSEFGGARPSSVGRKAQCDGFQRWKA